MISKLIRWIAAGCLSSLPAFGTPPNVIVIYCDDAGYGDFGFTGHPTIRTPHLDRMAMEGARFTQFYSGAPACSASRYALLTGRSPARSGLGSWVLFPDSERYLHPSERTIPELLKDKGYDTAMFGKWHLGFPNPKNQESPDTLPQAHGFDQWLGLPYSNDMLPGARDLPPLRLLRFPPSENAQLRFGGCEVVSENPDQSVLTKDLFNELTLWIKERKDRPFFAYLAHSMPHVPLHTSAEQAGKSPRGLYGDVMEEIDASTGKILDTLRSLEIEKRTLVIFSSDNGPWLAHDLKGGSSGLFRGGKGSAWEGAVRVPGLFWWPGTVDAGRVITVPASVLDLLPTAASLAGTQPPEDREMDGASLLPLLTGGPSQFPEDRIIPLTQGQNKLTALRSGPWKIHYKIHPSMGVKLRESHPFGIVSRQQPALFQIEHDPSELHNIATTYPGIIQCCNDLAEAFENSVKVEGSYWDK